MALLCSSSEGKFGTQEFKTDLRIRQFASLYTLSRGVPGLECFKLPSSEHLISKIEEAVSGGATVPVKLQFPIILNLNQLGIPSNVDCRLGSHKLKSKALGVGPPNCPGLLVLLLCAKALFSLACSPCCARGTPPPPPRHQK